MIDPGPGDTGGPARVSVLLPCYDAETYLPAAMDSLLAQTWRDLEILAIDDGSGDATLEVLRRYESEDPRVRVVVNEENLGLIATLNRGIDLARGDLIARMDADDVSLPDRIERQVAVLARRPDVDLVGTGAAHIDREGRLLRRSHVRATEPDAVDFLALLANPFIHGSIMARAPVLREWRYLKAPETLHAEDYDLFTRLLSGGVRACNLADPLYRLRAREGSVSRRFEDVQVDHFTRLAAAHLERSLGMRLDERVHRVAVNRMDPGVGAADVVRGVRAVGAVRRRFLDRREVTPEAAAEIDAVAQQQRWDIVIQALRRGTVGQRAAGILLLPGRTPALRSAGVRRYLTSKLPAGGAP